MSDEELGVVLSLKQKQQMLQGLGEVRKQVKGVGQDTKKSGDDAHAASSKWKTLSDRVDHFSGATGRARKVSGALFGVLVANSNGALGPIQEVSDKLTGVGAALDDSRSKAGKWAIGVGAAMTGAGAVLGTIASKEQTAHDQLRSAIEGAGGNWDDYRKQVDRNIKTGEHYGDTAARTMSVLNRLVLATHNPKDAFKTYNSVLQIAAARHIDVEKAALMVGRAVNGQGRSLQAFGIKVTNTATAQKTIVAASKAHQTALEQLKKAQQNSADTEARITEAHKKGGSSALKLAEAHLSVENATVAMNKATSKYGAGSGNAILASQKLAIAQAKYNIAASGGSKQAGLTLSEQIALRKSHEALAAAQEKVRSTADAVTGAQQAVAKSGSNADQINRQVSQYMGGQADAAARTFTGHMRALAAVLDDKLASAGGHVYKFLTIAGPAMMGLGAIIESGFIPKLGRLLLKVSGVQKAIDLMTASEALSGDAAVVAGEKVEASSASMAGAGAKNFGRLGAAIGGVALAIGTYKVATSVHGTGGMVASSLMGAAAGAAIGFSAGGPLGAAIGGAVGLFGGLATNVWNSANALAKANQEMRNWMTNAYQADQFTIGQQFNQDILKSLGNQPGLADILARAGVKVGDVGAAIRTGNAIGSPAGLALQAAVKAGTITQKEYQTGLTALQQFVDNFSSVVGNLDNLAAISGQASQHTNDILTGAKAALDYIYNPPGTGQPGTTYTPPSLGDLLTPPTHHTGGYAAFDGFVNMKPGEEIVHLPGGSTVVPVNNASIASMLGNQSEGDVVVPVKIELDGKVIAESTYKHTRNKAARL